MKDIVDFFRKNKRQIADFIDGVQVNHDKTLIKYGYTEDESVSVAFYIHNEPDASITDYEDKIKCLLNAEIDDVDDFESNLKSGKNCDISFTPFLKINDNPTIHAFQMIINYK